MYTKKDENFISKDGFVFEITVNLSRSKNIRYQEYAIM